MPPVQYIPIDESSTDEEFDEETEEAEELVSLITAHFVFSRDQFVA
jgi:hypothetical protein